MKTIKTRNTVKNIKVLDKGVNLSKRMKDAYTRTKERAEETGSSNHATPTEYASDNIQDTVQDAARDTVYHMPNPKQKAREKWSKCFQPRLPFLVIRQNILYNSPKPCEVVHFN